MVGYVLLAWAGVIVLAQCITWLMAGEWQPVPAVAIFMTSEAQHFFLDVVPSGISPVSFAPSIASLDSPEAVARRLAGSAIGLQRIVAWLLDVGVSLWFLLVGIVSRALSRSMTERARELLG